MTNIAIVPTSKYYEKNRLFDNKYNRNGLLDPYIHFYNKFNKQSISTIDMVDNLKKLDVVIFERVDLFLLTKIKLVNPKSLNILIPWEPEIVEPFHNRKFLNKISHYYDYVLTWNDDLVDDSKFFKFHFPINLVYPQVEVQNESRFKSKKLLTQISSNLESNQDTELYSLRKKMNFELTELIPNDYEFYGNGWDIFTLSTYKGITQDKFKTLSDYKFSLCFENMRETNGYITEKIFDCFKSSVVPIYYGAKNIETYIPSNTFIKFDEDAPIENLISSLRNISFEQWMEYLRNANEFMSSKRVLKFGIGNFSHTLNQFIGKTPNSTPYPNSKLFYLMIYHSISRLLSKVIKKLR